MKINLYGKYADKKSKAMVDKISKLPYLENETIAIMPDNHFNGDSNPIVGMTITTKSGKVIPNFVGGDIGCGITRKKLNINKETLTKIFPKLDNIIRTKIPTGITNRYKEQFEDINEEFKWRTFNLLDSMTIKVDEITKAKTYGSIGTLGGGNHYIEINEDEITKELFLTIHSGSRNFGQYVFRHYQKLAQKRIERSGNFRFSKENFNKKLSKIDNDKKSDFVKEWKKDRDIFMKKDSLKKTFPYLDGDDYNNYMKDMDLAQQFAILNRNLMCFIIIKAINELADGNIVFDDLETTHTLHNYVDKQTGICRKGAVEAKIGKEFDIALNMKDGLIVAIGIENKESNQSAPHGAGRYMSRTEFKKTKADLEGTLKDMEGVFTSSINEFSIDESPDAYKPKEVILEGLEGLATIKTILKPIYNFKDSKEPIYMRKKKGKEKK